LDCQKRRVAFDALSALLVAVALTAGAVSDCLTQRIPNALNLLLFFSGAAFRYGAAGMEGLSSGIEGAMLGFLFALPLYLFLGLGGGDIKLIAAAGMFLGPHALASAAVYAALLGASMAVFSILVSPRLAATRSRWSKCLRALRRGDDRRSPLPSPSDPAGCRMPLAPALSIGVLLAAADAGHFVGLSGIA
jgi:prepilin peptidase CpaA